MKDLFPSSPPVANRFASGGNSPPIKTPEPQAAPLTMATMIDLCRASGDVVSTCTVAEYGADNAEGIDAGDCPTAEFVLDCLKIKPRGPVSLWCALFARIHQSPPEA